MDQITTTFLDLLRRGSPLSPGERQERASVELPVVVSRSRLHWLATPESVNGTGDKLVVGVAVWSRYDLTLLDELNQFATANPSVRVCVFDVDRVGGGFERFVPGVGELLQTPVVGRWSGGVLVESGTGHDGREIARKLMTQPAPAAA